MVQEPADNNQGNPGKATTHNVDGALKALRKIIEKENLTSVALPRLATGVGGLAWNDVDALITKHLGDLSIPVFVYETYQKGVKASETLAKSA